MNRVFLIGNLTRDPELSTTSNGLSVCRLSLAVSRRYSGQDGNRETDFFNITVWRAAAENCAKFLKKGSKVAVAGSLQNRTYDANDGTKRTVTDIVADEVEFLSSKNDNSLTQQGTNENNAPVGDLQPVDDDTLPF